MNPIEMHQIVVDDILTGENDYYFDIRGISAFSFQLSHENEGSLLFLVSNDMRFTTDPTNATEMAQKQWSTFRIFKPDDETYVITADLTLPVWQDNCAFVFDRMKFCFMKVVVNGNGTDNYYLTYNVPVGP